LHSIQIYYECHLCIQFSLTSSSSPILKIRTEHVTDSLQTQHAFARSNKIARNPYIEIPQACTLAYLNPLSLYLYFKYWIIYWMFLDSACCEPLVRGAVTGHVIKLIKYSSMVRKTSVLVKACKCKAYARSHVQTSEPKISK
jgi:hypothetical protein